MIAFTPYAAVTSLAPIRVARVAGEWVVAAVAAGLRLSRGRTWRGP